MLTCCQVEGVQTQHDQSGLVYHVLVCCRAPAVMGWDPYRQNPVRFHLQILCRRDGPLGLQA